MRQLVVEVEVVEVDPTGLLAVGFRSGLARLRWTALGLYGLTIGKVFLLDMVGLDEIYDVPADVYAPCALGGTVNEQTLPRLKAKVICGSANNQLANNAIGDEVQKRGILYAPDYAVNAGGVMNVALEITGYNRERAMRMMRTIYHNLTRIFEIAERDGIPTYLAADRMAEERIQLMGKLKLPMGRTAPRFQGRIRGGH